MASPTLLTFDAEGRAVAFDVWLDDLQLFLQCDSRDGLSLFDLTSGASTASAADADSTVCSQWLTRDAAARLAVRIARYSSPATAALSRLMLPYLFPDLAAFATVTDLITHLRTSDTRYRAVLPAEFCAHNPPPMYITLYYLVTRLPDTLRSAPLVVTPVPLSLRGAPLFLFCPLLPLLLLSTLLALSRSALRLLLVRDAASARPSRARELEEVVGAAVVAVGEEEGVGVGVVAEVGASVAAVELEAAVAVAGGEAAAEEAAAEVEPAEAELCSGDPSSSSALVRPLHPSSFYAAHQLNLQPRVSLPETSPTLLWTGKVGDASAFRVWGSRAFLRDLSADKLSPRATPCVFLGFPPDAPGWQFYHPTSRRVLSSQDVTVDES
ncbi:unnamed protein product, partial [Closterium sp. NIES-54]